MKIAIVGTAKASRHLAPYGALQWAPPNGEIWCCGGYDFSVKRYDRWFEIHDRSVSLPNAMSGKTGWEMNDDVLAQTKMPVFVQEPRDGADHEEKFPIKETISMMGDRNFTSTPAFMMATAILRLRSDLCRTPEPQDMIGIWGIEMLVEDEHDDQRAGMHHFIDLCIVMNIEVLLPAGSGLIARPRVYAYEKETAEARRYRKLAESAQRRIDDLEANGQENSRRLHYEKGVLDTIKLLGRDRGQYGESAILPEIRD